MRASRKTTGLVLATALVGAVAAASPAAAVTRYAKPSGGMTECTTPETACEVNYAVETKAQPGEEVILAPGDYIFGAGDALVVNKRLNIHGTAGQARPRLVFSGSGNPGLNVLAAGANTQLAHLQPENVADGAALRVEAAAVAEDLVVRHTGSSGGSAVNLQNGAALLRDSVVFASGTGTIAVLVTNGAHELRNVTAIAAGSNGPAVLAFADTVAPPSCTNSGQVTARNVITRGGRADYEVESDSDCNNAGRRASATVTSSNYRTSKVRTLAGGAFNDGGGNQTNVDPHFVDVFGGDYHQVASSPTIDAGTTDAQIGPVDIDGQARTMGCAPDIGADEFASAPCPSSTGGGPAPGDPGPAVTPDTTAPGIASASLTNKVFAVNSRGPAEPLVSAQAKRGTSFRYQLSEDARVLFTIEKATAGRRVRGRCVRPTRSNRSARKCTRYVVRGRFAQQGAAGRNTKSWSGKLGRRALGVGKYRAVLTATDGAGNRSPAKRLSFRVVRR